MAEHAVERQTGQHPDVFGDLMARGTVKSATHPEKLHALLQERALTLYCGYDPTGDSLHIGNLVTIMGLARFQRAGHTPIAVVGGATGMIGDPSGKDAERQLLDEDTIAKNLVGIRADLERVLDFSGANAAKIVNNADWVRPLSVIDFLRDIGKHFRVNVMLRQDSVQKRIHRGDDETGDTEGMSFTEFSYSVIQALDFWHLYRDYGCTLQVGGSDQWGNIVAGLDLIHAKTGEHAYGLTFELLLDDNDEKFGKSTGGGGMFMSPTRTSPYKFYQHFINARDVKDDDSEVERYLKIFTFMPVEEIDELMREHNKNKAAREAQIRLASEVTRIVHGEAGLKLARTATDAFFGAQDIEAVDEAVLHAVFNDVPHAAFRREELATADGLPVIDALAAAIDVSGAPMFESKGDVKRSIKGGGVHFRGKRVTDINQRITPAELGDKTIVAFRKGKKYGLVRFTD